MKRGYYFRLACVRLIYRTVTVDLDSGLLHWLYTAIINAKAFILPAMVFPRKIFSPSWTNILSVSAARSFDPKPSERQTLAVGASVRLSERRES